MKTNSTKLISLIGVMTALSFVLYFFELPVGFILPQAAFLKIDFSDIPAILLSLSAGPVAGILVELLKNILHFLFINKDGSFVGELANFCAGVGFLIPVALIARKNFNFKTYVPALLLGTAVMALAMILINYFVTIPMYFPDMDSAARWGLINSAITPFNILKGILMSIVIVLLYPRLQSVLKKIG